MSSSALGRRLDRRRNGRGILRQRFRQDCSGSRTRAAANIAAFIGLIADRRAFHLIFQVSRGIFREKSVLLCTTAHACRRPLSPNPPVRSSSKSRRSSLPAAVTKDVGGIQTPDATKSKAVVTQEMISRSGPGPDGARHDQHRSGRQLPEQRRLRQLPAARSRCAASIRPASATRSMNRLVMLKG